MSADHDFAHLYQTLGIGPDAGSAALRLAYRRRVAALHPDRVDGDGEALKKLNILFRAAMEFERLNGRLPGALPSGRVAPIESAAAMPVAARVPRRRAPSFALGAVAIGVLLLWWNRDPPSAPAIEQAPAQIARTEPADHRAEAATRIEIGMSRGDVRSLQGRPIHEGLVQWDYGPSWIRFHCGRVSGWYSSPLRRLNVPVEQVDPDPDPPRCKARFDDALP